MRIVRHTHFRECNDYPQSLCDQTPLQMSQFETLRLTVNLNCMVSQQLVLLGDNLAINQSFKWILNYRKNQCLQTRLSNLHTLDFKLPCKVSLEFSIPNLQTGSIKLDNHNKQKKKYPQNLFKINISLLMIVEIPSVLYHKLTILLIVFSLSLLYVRLWSLSSYVFSISQHPLARV